MGWAPALGWGHSPISQRCPVALGALAPRWQWLPLCCSMGHTQAAASWSLTSSPGLHSLHGIALRPQLHTGEEAPGLPSAWKIHPASSRGDMPCSPRQRPCCGPISVLQDAHCRLFLPADPAGGCGQQNGAVRWPGFQAWPCPSWPRGPLWLLFSAGTQQVMGWLLLNDPPTHTRP